MIYVYGLQKDGKLYGINAKEEVYNYKVILKSTYSDEPIVLAQSSLHALDDIEDSKKGLVYIDGFPSSWSVADCFGNMSKTLKYRLSISDYDITVGDNDELISWIQNEKCDAGKDVVIDLRNFSSICELCFSVYANSLTFICKDGVDFPRSSLYNVETNGGITLDVSGLKTKDYIKSLISMFDAYEGDVHFIGGTSVYKQALMEVVKSILHDAKLFDNYVGSGDTDFINPIITRYKEMLEQVGALSKLELEYEKLTKTVGTKLVSSIEIDEKFYNALRTRVRDLMRLTGANGDYVIHALAFAVRAVHAKSTEFGVFEYAVDDELYYYVNLCCFLNHHDTLYMLGKTILDRFVFTDRIL